VAVNAGSPAGFSASGELGERAMTLTPRCTWSLISGNWLVYRVTTHDPPNPEDLAKQADQIKQQLLQGKQGAAFEAFRLALEDRLKQEGKLVINADVLKRLTRST